MRLPLRLFNRRWSSPNLDLIASFSVAVAAGEFQVECAAQCKLRYPQRVVHDSGRGSRQLRPLPQPQPQKPPHFLPPDNGPCGLPIDETDHHNRTGDHGWPVYSNRSSCSSCVTSQKEPFPCHTKRTLGHTACFETRLKIGRKCFG